MKVTRIPLGPLQTNGFLIHNEEKEAVFFDPGSDGEKVVSLLKEEELTLRAVVLTHAHFDHIGGVEAIQKELGVPVYVHEKEAEWLKDPGRNGSALFPGIPEISVSGEVSTLSGEGKVTFGPFEFDMLETPGHSPGSLSFYSPENRVIFSGDVLFQGGIGRTDLPGGDHDTLLNSIHTKLLDLPDETVVANGHGPETTIGTEKETNPFLNGF
ncbi:MBL fold metallo-hydrolase [Alteribacter natronophilus]|uniref:MBL fold metallo-hydrolase n=1 Tax=Alteribacter natronophilus TaxID=2583810 RepID=UPI00110E9C38|nr:MBL fold metallo-hydrolase [Alteribacter natronophilus]TMW73787.1 MBL fold metallo-hydrolase [Alteribacter natronophilus]